MTKVAPEPQEMQRMVPPPIVANLTFGGAVLVTENKDGPKGMICSPMGMITTQKCIQACCCPGCLTLDFTYVDGSYEKAISVETSNGGMCKCMQPHYKVSLKDYTQLAEDSHSKSHIESMRKKGKSDEQIAKLYPKKVLVGESRKKGGQEGCGCPIPRSYRDYGKRGCGPKFYATWGVKYPAGQGGHDAYYVKNKGACLKVCTTCPSCDNCSKGIAKGNFCMNYKVPIYKNVMDKTGRVQSETVVAYVVQTTPLIPTTCCTADPGPTIQMSIHKADESQEFSDEDIARMALFMFSLRPNVPGGGGGTHFIQKLSNMFLYKAGWLLGYYQKDVQTEYLSVKQVFNGEVAGFGDLMEKIRGK